MKKSKRKILGLKMEREPDILPENTTEWLNEMDGKGWHNNGMTRHNDDWYAGSDVTPTHYTATLSCVHDAVAPVFTLDGVRIFGTRYNAIDAYDWMEKTVVLNCSQHAIKFDAPLTHSDLALPRYMEAPDWMAIVDIDWQDMQAPPLPTSFWADFMYEVIRGEYKNVIVCCVGSHGRTGTALAALLINAGAETAASAIKTVRDLHCGIAGESAAQETYLKMLVKSPTRNRIECIDATTFVTKHKRGRPRKGA